MPSRLSSSFHSIAPDALLVGIGGRYEFHNKGIGPFKGEYQNKPRGRVFYSPQEDQYIIAVGEWFNENQEALPLILEEFDLPQDKTVVKQAHHWDIGQTWK